MNERDTWKPNGCHHVNGGHGPGEHPDGGGGNHHPTLDYHINVTISNGGLYPMDGIEATLNCYVENSTNEMFLPPGTLFASAAFTFGVIAPGNHSTTRVALHVTPGLNITIDCWLRNEFTITTSVVQFPMAVAGIFFAYYNAPP